MLGIITAICMFLTVCFAKKEAGKEELWGFPYLGVPPYSPYGPLSAREAARKRALAAELAKEDVIRDAAARMMY